MNELLVICGPTATGKTKLGIDLARKFNGEIVSADSRQVYRGMDIGTGKDLPTSSKFKVQFKIKNFRIGYYDFDGMPLWLLDIVEPDYRFNVADYKKCSDLVIKDILEREKLPIVVGGTGFYIKAITAGIETIGIEPDWELRNELQRSTVSELQRRLKDLDPEHFDKIYGECNRTTQCKLCRGMNESDKKNPRRLIRAIEIAKWKCEVRSGKLDNEVGNEKQKSHLSHQHLASNFQRPTSILFIGLTAPNKILYQRIDQRVEERVKMGAEEEIKKLLNKGYNWENSVLGVTIGYREWKDFFENKATREEVIQKWKFAEHGYARRQMTWFKKTLRQALYQNGTGQACTEQRRSTQGKTLRQALYQNGTGQSQGQWFDISKEGWEEEVEKLVEAWYS